jgi:uncharacterized protein
LTAASRQPGWLKQFYAWHWISSAACLVGILLFAVTGVTLNHAGAIPARETVTKAAGRLPPGIRERLAASIPPGGKGAVPRELAEWAATALSLGIAGRDAEWNGAEIYVSLPRPGGDAWLTADLETGEVNYERTDRGWIAYLNDLHKGRHTGVAWKWFLDVFAVACVVFSVTGLLLLQWHAGNRPWTWPLVALGLVVPALLAILFIH